MFLVRCLMVKADVEITDFQKKMIVDILKIGGDFKCQGQVFPGVGEPHSFDGVNGRKRNRSQEQMNRDGQVPAPTSQDALRRKTTGH